MEQKINLKKNYFAYSLNLLNVIISIFLLIYNIFNSISFSQEFTLINSYFVIGSISFLFLSLIGYSYIIYLINKNKLKYGLKKVFYLAIFYYPLYIILSLIILFIIRNINKGYIFVTSSFLSVIVIIFSILIYLNLRKNLEYKKSNNLKISKYFLISLNAETLNENTYEEKKKSLRNYLIFSLISVFFFLDFFTFLLSFLLKFNSLSSTQIIVQVIMFSLGIILGIIFLTLALHTGFKNNILSKKIFIKFSFYTLITIIYLVYFYLCISNLRPLDDAISINLYILISDVIYIALLCFTNIAYSFDLTYIKSIKKKETK